MYLNLIGHIMKVKVKHSVVPDPDGIDAMINTIIAATKVVYATEIDEKAAMVALITPEIEEVVSKAFKAGKKIGKMDSDSSDTKMYVTDMAMATEDMV